MVRDEDREGVKENPGLCRGLGGGWLGGGGLLKALEHADFVLNPWKGRHGHKVLGDMVKIEENRHRVGRWIVEKIAASAAPVELEGCIQRLAAFIPILDAENETILAG